MAAKEKCPKCGGDKIAFAKDDSGKRFCQTSGCMHIWAPLTKDAAEIETLKRQIAHQAAELNRLRDQVMTLKNKYEPAVPEQVEDAKIFE